MVSFRLLIIIAFSDPIIGQLAICPSPFILGPSPNGDSTRCYYFSGPNIQAATWFDARGRCRSLMNSQLTSISTQAEQNFIVNHAGVTDKLYIGGDSLDNNKLIFSWLMTDTLVSDGFTFWGPGEPNGAEEKCMQMDNTPDKYPKPWMWNNVECGEYELYNTTSPYVCAFEVSKGNGTDLVSVPALSVIHIRSALHDSNEKVNVVVSYRAGNGETGDIPIGPLAESFVFTDCYINQLSQILEVKATTESGEVCLSSKIPAEYYKIIPGHTGTFFTPCAVIAIVSEE